DVCSSDLLINVEIDINHILQTFNAGGVKADVPIPDCKRRIAWAWKQLLADNLEPVRVEHSDQFLPPCFSGGNILPLVFPVCLFVEPLFVHADFSHLSMIVSASFISSLSFSAVKMFISSSSFAGRRTSQSPE